MMEAGPKSSLLQMAREIVADHLGVPIQHLNDYGNIEVRDAVGAVAAALRLRVVAVRAEPLGDGIHSSPIESWPEDPEHLDERGSEPA